MLGLAAGLHALGLERGDRVSLFSENSSRWLVVDQVRGGLFSQPCFSYCNDRPSD